MKYNQSSAEEIILNLSHITTQKSDLCSGNIVDSRGTRFEYRPNHRQLWSSSVPPDEFRKSALKQAVSRPPYSVILTRHGHHPALFDTI